MSPARVAAELAGLARAWVRSGRGARTHRETFANVERYCMFIGYPRSGHTLVGALLDAHEDAAISHELGALKYVAAGFDRDRLYQLIVERATRPADTLWQSGRYVYRVPGQWQGRWRVLRVIGDKQAEGATLRIRARPRLLARLRALVPALRMVHVTRNPFDNIATMAVRAADGAAPDLAAAAERYFALCATVSWIAARSAPGEILSLRHEEFIANPRRRLAALCTHVGLDAAEDYLEACAAIVRSSAHRSRDRVAWSAALRDRVERGIAEHEFLSGYGFDDPATA